MLERKGPRGQPGAEAIVGPGNLTTSEQLHITTVSESRQFPHHLLTHAQVAERNAEACRLMWEICRLIGDDQGAVYWRKRQLNHQAVQWAATHPGAEVRP
jgi:hypothetical protein